MEVEGLFLSMGSDGTFRISANSADREFVVLDFNPRLATMIFQYLARNSETKR